MGRVQIRKQHLEKPSGLNSCVKICLQELTFITGIVRCLIKCFCKIFTPQREQVNPCVCVRENDQNFVTGKLSPTLDMKWKQYYMQIPSGSIICLSLRA